MVEKSNGKVRVCLDLGDLNRATRRPHHNAPTGRQIADKLAGKTLFTVLDLTQAYHQVQLDDESSDVCCFNTPFGRYRFLRMPFGIKCASDVFQSKNEEVFGDIDGSEVISDELLLHTVDDPLKHIKLMREVFEVARKNGVTLNKEKIQAMSSSVKYMGDMFTSNGTQADPDKIQAIVEMPAPQNKKDLKRFLGMVNYVGHFVPNLSSMTQPLRSLLKNQALWIWDSVCNRAFIKLKNLLTGNEILAYFDPSIHSTLQVDASMKGLGVCLLQDNKPVAYRSRSLTPAEQNYSNIEREMLAAVWGCEVLSNFVYGMYITIQSDHKPLVEIVKKPMHKISPRLRRLALRLYVYAFNLEYLPGSKMMIADALSRACGSGEITEDEDAKFSIHNILVCPVSDARMLELRTVTTADVQLQLLIKYIMFGFPEHKKDVCEEVRPFWDVRNELSYIEDLVLYGNRIIIPLSMQNTIIELLHSSHMGMVKTKARANEIVYWPGMSSQLERIISNCRTCNTYRNSNQRETLIPHEIPPLPWEKLGTDSFTFGGKDYLIIVDYFSKCPEVVVMKNKTSSCVRYTQGTVCKAWRIQGNNIR